MSWDPAVLRKFNTTGHFRLLNQVRVELKSNPLVRPEEGQTIGEVNRSRALIRATEGRGASAGRGRRGGSSRTPRVSPSQDSAVQEHGPFTVVPLLTPTPDDTPEPDAGQGAASFRDRLDAVELR